MNPSAQGEPSSDGSPPTDADHDRETRTYPVLESQTASAHRIGCLLTVSPPEAAGRTPW